MCVKRLANKEVNWKYTNHVNHQPRKRLTSLSANMRRRHFLIEGSFFPNNFNLCQIDKTLARTPRDKATVLMGSLLLVSPVELLSSRLNSTWCLNAKQTAIH